jgi:hypothetical protein
MGFIGAAVGLLITLAIVVLIYFNVAGSMNTNAIDDKLGATFNGTTGAYISGPRPAYNATGQINAQATTFFTIAPIISIVICAIVVISYVQRIGG